MSQLKVTMKRSSIGQHDRHVENLKGLGLRRIGDERLLENTPAVRGMVKAVLHLVHVEEVR